MKEFTIEQKANAYGEAIKRAKDLISRCKSNRDRRGMIYRVEDIEGIFPELKESEEEKSKKWILECLYDGLRKSDEQFKDHFKTAISWLEKQGGEDMIPLDKVIKFLDDQLVNDRDEVTGEPFINFQNYGAFKETFISFFKRKMLEKQGEPQILGIGVENASGVLKECIDKIRPKSAMKAIKEEKADNTNKIEPKFKVGDWITDGKSLLHITKFEDDYGYELKTIDGEVFHFVSPDLVKANYHLWTIQDAKDGDVLAAHECVVLFKEIDGLNIKCYCTYHYMNNPSFHINTLQNKSAFCPATIEERGLIFSKMHEAGYMWDSESKQLLSLKAEPIGEQKPVIEMKTAEESLGIDSKTYNKIVDECIYGEQKLNWSEEDEEFLRRAINATKDAYPMTANWLKSLKERIYVENAPVITSKEYGHS